MSALEKYNDAFDEQITNPNADMIRLMMDIAALRGRKDLAADLAAECAIILNPPPPPAMGRREFHDGAPLYPLFANPEL